MIITKRFKTNFTEEELKSALFAKKDQAEEILNDKNKWEKFKVKFESFLHKAYDIPVLGTVIDDIISMYQLVESYVKREYTDIPLTSIISILAALVYVISPIDLIPDFIPVIGYLDDAAVVTLVLGLGVGHDLEKYKSWQEKLRDNAIEELEEQVGEAILELLDDRALGALILSKDETVRVYAVEDIEEEPYRSTVYSVNLPVTILKKMYLEKEEDYIAFLNGVIENTDFEWSPVGRLDAIHEAFIHRYENYFDVEEGVLDE